MLSVDQLNIFIAFLDLFYHILVTMIIRAHHRGQEAQEKEEFIHKNLYLVQTKVDHKFIRVFSSF
jgi:hypothetical protein